MAFVVPGVVSSDMAPVFANPAAYGDLLAALLALLAVIALRRGWTLAISLTWIFNIIGLLDLLNALFQGVQHVDAGQFRAAYFIPTVAVPALLITHVMIFRLLVRREEETG